MQFITSSIQQMTHIYYTNYHPVLGYLYLKIPKSGECIKGYLGKSDGKEST